MRTIARNRHASSTARTYPNDRLLMHLEELKSLSVIEEVANEERFYKLTKKGIEFLNQFRTVERFAGAFGFAL